MNHATRMKQTILLLGMLTYILFFEITFRYEQQETAPELAVNGSFEGAYGLSTKDWTGGDSPFHTGDTIIKSNNFARPNTGLGANSGFTKTMNLYSTPGAATPLAAFAQLTWDANSITTGIQEGAGIWNTTLPNWWNGAINVLFISGDDAVFGNGISGTAGVVTLGTALTVNSLTFDNPFAGNYTISGSTLTLGGTGSVTTNSEATIASVLAGTVGLTKKGGGKLNITAANTYTGITDVDTGHLSIGNGGSVGSINAASPVDVATGATITWNNANTTATKTIANTISGAGTLYLKGTNITDSSLSLYALTGNNTGFSGNWISDGALMTNVNVQTKIGPAPITLRNNGGIYFNGGTYSNDFVIEDGAGWSYDIGAGVNLGAIRMEGTTVLNGNIALNQNTGITLGESTGDDAIISGWSLGNHTLNGVISGTGEFSMSRYTGYNGGSVQYVNITLAGTNSNTYTGKTIVDGQSARATLILNKTAGARAIADNNWVQFGSDTGGQANLHTIADNQFGSGVVMDWANTVPGNWGRFALTGTNQTLAGLDGGIARPTMVIQNEGYADAGSPMADATLTLDGSGTYAAYGIIRDEDDGGTLKKLHIIKDGTGTQTLGESNNDYIIHTGTTTINSGILISDATLATSAWRSPIIINPGAEFRTIGTKRHASLPVGATVNLNGGTYTYATTAATAYDVVSGLVTVSAPSVVNLDNTNDTTSRLFFDDGIAGSADVTVNSTAPGPESALVFRGDLGNDLYTGTINMNSGNIIIGTSAQTVLRKATLNLATGTRLRMDASWAVSAANAQINSLNGDGNVTLGGRLYLGANNGNSIYNGVISGTNGFDKSGTGTVLLGGVNTYTGTSDIQTGGILGGTGSIGSSATYVKAGATIMGGTGTGNTGTFTTGALHFANNTAKLQVNTNGTNATNKIVSQAAVTLNNMTVDIDGALEDGTYDLITGTSVIGAATLGSHTLTSPCVKLANTVNSLRLIVGCVPISPGGVNVGLNYWVKADGQIIDPGTSVTSWVDETGAHGDFLSVVGDPDLQENGMNFNPTVNFDGNDYILIKNSSSIIPGATAGEIFYTIEATSAHNVAGGYPGQWGGSGVLTAQYDYSNANIYDTFGTTVRKNWDPRTAPAEGPIIEIMDPHIYNIYSAPGDWSANFDGTPNFSTASNTVNFDSSQSAAIYIGASASSVFWGNISETILYNRKLTAEERQRVNSYQAAKYGISLDQTTATDYLASDGTTRMWAAANNTGYDNNITVIGRDDMSALNQKQSRSVTPNGLVTIGKTSITATNAINPATFAADYDFLSFGDNDGENIFVPTGAPTSRLILGRTWKVEEVGTDASDYKLSVSDNSSTYSTNLPGETGVIYLLQDTDSDFTSGASEIAMTLNGTEWETPGTVDFDNGQFFTFATNIPPAPGGVTTNLDLWYKADDGVVTTDGAPVLNWKDSSPAGYDGVVTGDPIHVTGQINFNPAVYYDGVGDGHNAPVASAMSGAYSSYNIAQLEGTLNSRVFSSIGNNSLIGFWNNRENVVYINGSPNFLGGPAATTAPKLYSFNRTTDGSFDFRAFGKEITGGAGSSTVAFRYGIANGGQYPGEISRVFVPEVIAYKNVVSPNEQQRIESYLAIKYGMTLDAGIVDYLNSSGNSVYNLASNNNNVFGIARDDASALDQQISKSIDAGSIVTISTDGDFTTVNGTHTSLSDGQFLMIGNDGGILTNQTTEMDATTYYERTIREWRVENTGAIGAINLKFDGFDQTYVLVTDNDGDFSMGATNAGALSATGEITGITLADNSYFTLARLATKLEFEAATAADVEATGGNLPNLLIDGTLLSDTDIDIVIGAGGTATPVTDYTLGGATVLPQTITVTVPTGTYTATAPIALGSLSLSGGGTVGFSILDEAIVEADETIELSLSNAQTGLVIKEVAGGTLIDNHIYTITNDDVVTVEFDLATANDLENIGANLPVLYISGTVANASTITVTDTGSGSADSGADYAFVSPQIVNIPAGVYDGTAATAITLPTLIITDDTNVEVNETVDLELGAVTGDVSLGTQVTHAYTIADDESANLTLSIVKITDADEATPTNAVFTVSLDGGVTNESGVAITGTVSLGGTATAGADYTDVTLFSIAEGTSWTIVTVPVIDDPAVEVTETIIATISNPSLGVVSATDHDSADITDNDVAEFSVAPTAITINENAGTGTFTIVLSAQPVTDVVFNITSSDMAETTVDQASITFTNANWDTPQPVTVTGVDDTMVATHAAIITIAIDAAASDDAFNTLADQTVAVTLTNDDIPIGPVVSDTAFTLEENGGTAEFTVVLGSPPGLDVMVNLVAEDAAEATVDLSQLTFTNANWNISQTITVTGVDDMDPSGNNSTFITVTVDPASDPAYTALPDNTIQLTLINDDFGTGTIGTQISVTDGSAIANGVDKEAITVQLRDDAGMDISKAGVNVTFAVSGDAQISSSTSLTDANGSASVTVTNTRAEIAAITATVDTDNDGGITPEIAVVNGSPAQVVFTPDPYLSLDSDGDGISNDLEIHAGTDENNPCDPVQPAAYAEYDSTNAIWAAADCDGDRIANGREISDGSDPFDSCSALGGTPPSGTECGIEIANELITPNSDGINDVFRIRNIERFPDNTVEILNRYGVKVFSIRGYDNQNNVFKGMSNRRATIQRSDGLPAGVYFYFINYNDKGRAVSKSGYLYITQ